MASEQAACRSPRDWADWSLSRAFSCSDLGGRPKSRGPKAGRKGVGFLMEKQSVYIRTLDIKRKMKEKQK